MNDENKMVDDMILNGVLEACGVDIETGELLYNFTEKLADYNQDLYREFQNHLSSEAMKLWENGFIEMDVTANNPVISLTEKAFDDQEVLKLGKENQATLKEIIRILTEK